MAYLKVTKFKKKARFRLTKDVAYDRGYVSLYVDVVKMREYLRNAGDEEGRFFVAFLVLGINVRGNKNQIADLTEDSEVDDYAYYMGCKEEDVRQFLNIGLKFGLFDYVDGLFCFNPKICKRSHHIEPATTMHFEYVNRRVLKQLIK